MVSERTEFQDEMRRQRIRLEQDLVSRQLGVAFTCILFGLFLPFWVVFLTYMIGVATEFSQRWLMLQFEANPTFGLRIAVIANSAFGVASYCVPALLIWQHPDPLIKIAAVLSLVGALLNVSSLRSTFLNMGLASLIPPALALIWLPLQHAFDPGSTFNALVATCAVLALVGYFFTAIFHNNRAQSDLMDLVQKANVASNAKSQFLSAMSHEVRTPLNAILGHSELLRDETDINAAHSHATAVEAAARRLQMLVEDVIDLTQVTEGEIQFSPATAVIRRELDAVAAMSLPNSTGSRPEFSIEISPEVPEFGRFDPILMRKCLSHLGAIVLAEQSDDGVRHIDMRCTLAPARPDRLRVTLSGRELGQPGKNNADAATEQSLAMTLVDTIADVMGARASVLRAPDGNLLARIELPFVTVPEPPATGAETIYGRLRVLVVDDIATNRFVVMQMLRTLRIEAVEAAGGADALAQLAAEPFDLVLLDMNMPDMDGEATFREIRGSETGWRSVPVVALTADAVSYRRDHYLALGLNGYISKPIDRRLLWAEILAAAPPPPPL